MRYVIRVTTAQSPEGQPLESAEITDEARRLLYRVDSVDGGQQHALIMRDAANRYVATIRQSATAILPWGYEIARSGQETAKIHRNMLSFLGERLTIDLEGDKDDLDVKGDLLAHDYAISREGHTIASVSKRWIARADTYGVEIADGQDDTLVLASVLALDAIRGLEP